MNKEASKKQDLAERLSATDTDHLRHNVERVEHLLTGEDDLKRKDSIDNYGLKKEFKDTLKKLMPRIVIWVLVLLAAFGVLLILLTGRYFYLIWQDPTKIETLLLSVATHIGIFFAGTLMPALFGKK